MLRYLLRSWRTRILNASPRSACKLFTPKLYFDFQKIDTDKDGVLSSSEYMELACRRVHDIHTYLYTLYIHTYTF